MPVRVVFRNAGWRTLYREPAIQADVAERAGRVAAALADDTSDTAYVAEDSGPTRRSGRARAAVIASDVPPRRDATYRALLAALDAGR